MLGKKPDLDLRKTVQKRKTISSKRTRKIHPVLSFSIKVLKYLTKANMYFSNSKLNATLDMSDPNGAMLLEFERSMKHYMFTHI